MRAASAAAVVAVLLLSGCGGAASPPPRHIQLTPVEQQGKALFLRTCGSCHTLADAGTSSVIGPALELPWSASRVRETIADGPGMMPAQLLSGRQAAAVAAYVAAATGA